MTVNEPRAVSIIVAGDAYEVGGAFIKTAVEECGYLVFDLRDIDVGYAQTGPCANRAWRYPMGTANGDLLQVQLAALTDLRVVDVAQTLVEAMLERV